MSENVNTPKYDKSNWQKGLGWENEADRVDFIHAGFSCLILRNHSGNWCGYVGVPKEHPAYDMDMYDIPVDVHGGVTYKERCAGHICHVPQPGMPDDVMWIGFDTAHAWDVSPGRPHELRFNNPNGEPGVTYKNQAYVTQETKQLAEQLAKLK